MDCSAYQDSIELIKIWELGWMHFFQEKFFNEALRKSSLWFWKKNKNQEEK